MKRVAIFGPGGAGKSTFARALGERIDLPVVHLDRFCWKPGWVETNSSCPTPPTSAALARLCGSRLRIGRRSMRSERAESSGATILERPHWNPEAHHHEATMVDAEGHTVVIHGPCETDG